MDPELVGLVSQLDQTINNLPLNSAVSADKIRDLQNKRSNLDKEMADFRADLDRRNDSFKSRLKSQIDSIQDQINNSMKNAA